MKQLNKDYRLLALATVFTSIATLLLFNIKDILNNSTVWQIALLGLAGIIVFTLVNMFMLSQKLRDHKALKIQD